MKDRHRIYSPGEDFCPGFVSCNMWNKKESSYEIIELDLSRPLAAVTVPQGRSGLAFVVRLMDRPVGFFMEPLLEGAELSSRELADRVLRHCGVHLLREKIYAELQEPCPREPLPSLDITICTHNRADTLARC